MPGLRYFLAIQTSLPDDYRNDRSFRRTLEVLQRAGYHGVELNIRDPRAEDPQRLAGFLTEFGLSFSMLATGLAARADGLSLASREERRRAESVRRTKEFLAFASAIGGGVIAGYLKCSMDDASQENRERLRDSVAELAPEAQRMQTPFLVEAVNRFESPLGNTLADVMDLLPPGPNPFIQVLPDTWHMSIEEARMEAALIRCAGRFSSIHLSDSNRFFPGFGGLDFGRIISVLDALGYRGRLAVEGNVKASFAEDASRAAEYLRPRLRSD